MYRCVEYETLRFGSGIHSVRYEIGEVDNSLDEEGEVKTERKSRMNIVDGEIVLSLYLKLDVLGKIIHSWMHPPGFTPLTHNCENDTSEKKVDQNDEFSEADDVDKLKGSANGSISAGHFKVSEIPRTGGSMISLKQMAHQMEREVSNDEIKKSAFGIEWLDDVLGKFGFGDKWRKWIQCCLHSSKGSIIINGSPTDEFQFGRGLKQGDPLSPFLFLLIMESLHISFQRVVDAGMFHGIDVGGLVNLSHMFYADDAVFIGEWSESNITSLIHVLDCFHKVSGLKINMCKSKIMGIEVDNGKVSRAATKFGCLVLKAPFLYLGSYVGGDMNKIQSWKDIIDRIRRRLSRWKMKMLSIGGRLMLIKSVLGSMPIFHMSMFKVPAGVIQILESLRSKFFNGHESSGKKASWVQWKKALAPKDNGGLGIFSLYALNRGLIFKWVWRFLAHEPTLWSRVIKAIHGANGKIDEISGKGANSCWINIIKEVRRLEEKGINLLLFMKKKLGNGLSTLFWDDVWCDGGKLKNRFPRAYALENSKQITVGQKLAHPSLYHSFRRHPRGGLELTQVEELAKVINPVVLTQSPDSWSWTLNNSGGYTVASSRNMIDSRLLPKGDLKTRWIRYVPNKVNTFAWKVMTNSLPTRFNISRRGIDIESLSCVNCDVGIETNDHLFFACNTAKKISKLINRWWDVPFMDINSYGEWRSWIDNVKLPKKNKSMFQGLPYVEEVITPTRNWLIFGDIELLSPIKYKDGLDHYRLSPMQLYKEFDRHQADAVFAFQLRNPLNNGHAFLDKKHN
ncbi:RNA-directed DNA polymerase, eukaryota, reverse transcriptase zinc-binding domain protein [Tanacetum coccineum]|uniref:RNA-directed DNA polymerase, eukaryota, reverse transcriptase zinc-binding domain protein n=1 Tax=Tanacetum coccineum TaxID=301880 RepID=A0ABQ4WPI4_9ASTR